MPDPDPADPAATPLWVAAKAVLADPPPPADWEAGRDEGMPRRDWHRTLRAAGWPVRVVTWALPTGRGGGTAPQQVTVVPYTWLVALAARMGVPMGEACRGKGRYE